jgi:hypothetical protein
MYDLEFAYRNGKDEAGRPASLGLRSVSAVGYAVTHGLSCQGAYYALRQQADGHRDPKTGQCTAISTQYRIKAIPAFVIGAP